MSTHKHFDKICCVVLVVTLIITVLFMNGESLGIQKISTVLEYENKLFDTSTVHSINIIMDDWDTFVENCESEEYYTCSVVIDDDVYKNVAIRAKGNTSLTQVKSYGNNRYSFKIEFDHNDNSNSYYGLDKLCLNNIIQDNTYMKDYLTYQMMAEMGVASPLCSFAYITVNNEDWGLYLAVEGIEESFLQRNYGNDYGELYKPDSQSMGAGKGNGGNFDIKEFVKENTESDSNTEEETTSENTVTEAKSNSTNIQIVQTSTNTENRQMPNGMQGGQMPEDFQNGEMPDNIQGGQMPEDFQNGQMPDNMQGGQMPEDFQNGQIPDNMQGGQMPEDFQNGQTNDDSTPPELPSDQQATTDDNTNAEQDNAAEEKSSKSDKGFGNMGGRGNSSDDVLLKYIDDEIDSYSNIFDNAKTNVSNSDKKRLIESLKNLSQGENIEDTVDVEKVISYFVVHNFVLNFDSYTGSMIHNYYLYEDDGQMQMIPWDYNLAFGGFQSAGDTTSLVNYPIDSPVSSGSVEDRPMLAWIFDNEEYTQMYHQYFSKFICEYFDSGYFEEMMDSVVAMISPYVEKDPTKFCTYEEFKTGVATLKEFCLLRAESINAQLDGTIGSTSQTQTQDTLIDPGDIKISDMGSMNNSMGNMKNRESNNDENMQKAQDDAEQSSDSNDDLTVDSTDDSSSNTVGELSDEMPNTPPNLSDGNEMQPFGNRGGMDNQNNNPFDTNDSENKGDISESDNVSLDKNKNSIVNSSDFIWLGISVIVLAVGLVIAIIFKRRK